MQNLGKKDKIIRIFILTFFVILAALETTSLTIKIILWFFSLILAISIWTHICPFYKIFNISTKD